MIRLTGANADFAHHGPTSCATAAAVAVAVTTAAAGEARDGSCAT